MGLGGVGGAWALALNVLVEHSDLFLLRCSSVVKVVVHGAMGRRINS